MMSFEPPRWAGSSSGFLFILETSPVDAAKTAWRGLADLYEGVATGSLGGWAPTGSDLAKFIDALGRSTGGGTGKCVGESSAATLEPDDEVVIDAVVKVLERGWGWCGGRSGKCAEGLGRGPRDENGLSRASGCIN
jgi:hypothetical protein